MVAGVYNEAGSGAVGGGGEQAPRAGVNLGEFRELENTFITLLVAQIKNQDPTSPLDSSEFLNQFSTMSQVQSMQNMTSMTQSNLVLLDNLQMLTAAGLVGDEVSVGADVVDLGTGTVNGQVELRHPAARTVLELTSERGVVHEIELGPQTPGAVPFQLDAEALGLAPGRYGIRVLADSGERPLVELSGTVTNVRVSPEGPLLEIEGLGRVPFYKILEFRQDVAAS